MKQKLTALLLVLLLAVTLVLPVMAAETYVDDEAAILTLSEVETLEARAAEISEHYGVGVYICIVDDFGDYGYPDVATASYSIYHAQSLGYGSGRDGILLLLSMSNRKYATFVYGDKAEPIFPDAKLIKLENAFLDDFADDDWYDGFSDYLEGCASILSVDSGEFTWPQFLRRLGISFGVGLLLALIVCQLLKMKMRSVYRQAEASAYVTAEGLAADPARGRLHPHDHGAPQDRAPERLEQLKRFEQLFRRRRPRTQRLVLIQKPTPHIFQTKEAETDEKTHSQHCPVSGHGVQPAAVHGKRGKRHADQRRDLPRPGVPGIRAQDRRQLSPD